MNSWELNFEAKVSIFLIIEIDFTINT